MLNNARHTGLVVQDLDKEIDFYQKLGFKMASRDIETGDFIEQVTGIDGVKLEWVKMSLPDGFLLELLHYHEQSKKEKISNADSNKLGCSHIAFTVSDINDIYEKIINYGGNAVNSPALAPNGKVKVMYCHDPEGILMEIVEEL